MNVQHSRVTRKKYHAISNLKVNWELVQVINISWFSKLWPSFKCKEELLSITRTSWNTYSIYTKELQVFFVLSYRTSQTVLEHRQILSLLSSRRDLNQESRFLHHLLSALLSFGHSREILVPFWAKKQLAKMQDISETASSFALSWTCCANQFLTIKGVIRSGVCSRKQHLAW